MKKFKKGLTLRYSKGFTLIELLVVVAIIGVLTSIVLVSLTNSKNKGADAAVKSNLNTIRGMSELFYANNGNSFLPTGGIPLAITTPCPTYLLAGTNMLQKDKIIADAIAEALKRGTGSACYNSSLNWAVAVTLRSSDGATSGSSNTLPDSWCVDSGGASKSYAWASGETIVNSINVTFCK